MRHQEEHKLSIIIPCYNCEETLEEAVNSVYTQNLITPFEIVVVNDASTDSTQERIETLAKKYNEIRYFRHEENSGGGAARNTGIKNSVGDIIYCLDSDNVFAPNSVQSMIDYMIEKKADGMAFYERRFFYGSNLDQYTTHLNSVTDRPIELLDIFHKPNILLDNFFYTRESYFRTSGYPEHHGFDTQHFEVRFLSAGNRPWVCPNSVFYHRQATRQKSYFQRVYESGMFSVNFSLIFEDILHLFSSDFFQKVLNFNIFSTNTTHQENIYELVRNGIESGNVFLKNYTDYLHPESRRMWLKDEKNKNIPSYPIIQALSLYSEARYEEALKELCVYLRTSKTVSPYIEFFALRTLNGISGTSRKNIERETLKDIQEMAIRTISTGPSWFLRLTGRYPWIRAVLSKVKSS